MGEDELKMMNHDLQDFADNLSTIKNNETTWYDENLKIPHWQKTNTEDFANDVLGNIAKFAAHSEMLQNQNPLITDEQTNKNALLDLSNKLIDQIELYSNKLSQSERSRFRQLLENLKNISKLLKNIVNQNKPFKP